MGSRRQSYLNALGIDAWALRSRAPAEATRPIEPAPAARAASVAEPPPPRRRAPVEAGVDPVVVPPSRPEAPAAIAPRRKPDAAAPAPSPAAGPVIALTPAVDVPRDWAGLRESVRDCPRCKLCATRTQTVFGVGPEDAPLLVVGEGPGADEDARGEPFVGRAGQLLDQMLAAIGRSRGTDTYIANVVKCRPPGNREPEADEVEACRPYLDRQIELIKPRLIVGLGRIAAQRLLRTDQPLSRLRGPVHRYEGIPVFITYHPAYLLRSPREKAKSWQDLKQIHRLLLDPALDPAPVPAGA